MIKLKNTSSFFFFSFLVEKYLFLTPGDSQTNFHVKHKIICIKLLILMIQCIKLMLVDLILRKAETTFQVTIFINKSYETEIHKLIKQLSHSWAIIQFVPIHLFYYPNTCTPVALEGLLSNTQQSQDVLKQNLVDLQVLIQRES